MPWKANGCTPNSALGSARVGAGPGCSTSLGRAIHRAPHAATTANAPTRVRFAFMRIVEQETLGRGAGFVLTRSLGRSGPRPRRDSFRTPAGRGAVVTEEWPEDGRSAGCSG